MDIPAFFTSRTDDRLSVSCGRFTSTKTEHWGPAVPFNEATGAGIIREERSPAVVVDVDSLESKAFNEGVMKIMKVRGADLWFMTYIETVDDVFDAFTPWLYLNLTVIPKRNVKKIKLYRHRKYSNSRTYMILTIKYSQVF